MLLRKGQWVGEARTNYGALQQPAHLEGAGTLLMMHITTHPPLWFCSTFFTNFIFSVRLAVMIIVNIDRASLCFKFCSMTCICTNSFKSYRECYDLYFVNDAFMAEHLAHNWVDPRQSHSQTCTNTCSATLPGFSSQLGRLLTGYANVG